MLYRPEHRYHVELNVITSLHMTLESPTRNRQVLIQELQTMIEDWVIEKGIQDHIRIGDHWMGSFTIRDNYDPTQNGGIHYTKGDR